MRGKPLAPAMPPHRLPSKEGEPVAFRWGRARVQGREGDTVASALLAAGHTILARSVKYHRPRSYLCGVGKCASCLVTIDGKPSQRACMVPLREGMRVEAQNCWPSARLDVFAANDVVLRRFDPQRSFTRPTWLHPLYYAFVRRMAGLGKVPRTATPARPGTVAQQAIPLAVVGAGPGGLAAALEAARAGTEVRVLDEQPALGGRLSWEDARLTGPSEFDGLSTGEALRSLLDGLRSEGVRPETGAMVAGIYPERLLAVQTPQRLVELRADAVVLATGAPESLPLFGDNDRPGVMSASGAAILLQRHGVLPGQRVVLAGRDSRTEGIVASLERAGAHAEVVEGEVVRALGSRWVTGCEVRTREGARTLACDLLVHAEPRRPAVELAQQAGCALAWHRSLLAPTIDRARTTAARVLVAGDLASPGSIEAALASGRVAGLQAAQDLGLKVDEGRLAKALEELARLRGQP